MTEYQPGSPEDLRQEAQRCENELRFNKRMAMGSGVLSGTLGALSVMACAEGGLNILTGVLAGTAAVATGVFTKGMLEDVATSAVDVVYYKDLVARASQNGSFPV